jgi:uncharacterized protein RhaS with RHS repeats
MLDISSNPKPQTLYVYNQGRLENEIYPDNSIIQYTYDANVNLIKKSKGYRQNRMYLVSQRFHITSI